jgi:DNA-binding XRE family transcriptional regulator
VTKHRRLDMKSITPRKKGTIYPERMEQIKQLRLEERWTLKELGEKFGVSRERIRQIIKSANIPARLSRIIKPKIKIRKAAKSGSLVEKGMDVEYFISQLLLKNGIENKLMPGSRPFDILLSDGRRVEVKSRHMTNTIRKGKKVYHFNLPKNRTAKEHAEFFILVTPEDIFFIPSSVIPDKKKGISFLYPEGFSKAGHKTNYWKYRGRVDLLK